MASYKEAQHARKNAVERYRYYRRKHDIMDTYDKSSQSILPLHKGMDEEYYEAMKEYYNSLDPEYFENEIEENYYEPEDDTAPFDVSLSEEYSERLHDVNETIGSDFDNMLDYVYNYTSLSELDIEDLLLQCEDYISTIESIYQGYVSNRPGRTEQDQRNNMYWAAKKTLNKMMKDVFHVYARDY